MQPLRTHEQGWLDAMRQVWGRVFIGLDHHSRQVTIAAAAGEQFQANRAAQSANWMLTSIFDQDGLGYADLLDWLTTNFPTTPRDRFVFASEPTFSKPLASFLISAGFCADQILWVKTTEVGPYRKAKGIGKAGKNDTDDSRALATMAFEAAADPHEHRSLFIAAPCSPVADGLRYLAMDHERVTKYSVSLQNRITDLALRLFPECRRVWYRDEKSRKPDGSVYEQRLISLFDTELPMKILEKFPSAQDVAEAGFDELWRLFGGRGLRKQVFLDLVSLAQRSGGTRNPLDAKRLCSMIQEYQQARERLGTYRDLIQVVAGADPVLKSFESIAFLGPQAIATIVGELGDVSRFKDFNAVKRYVNVAPVPMPQTGNVDETGRPVQVWRLSANGCGSFGTTVRT